MEGVQMEKLKLGKCISSLLQTGASPEGIVARPHHAFLHNFLSEGATVMVLPWEMTSLPSSSELSVIYLKAEKPVWGLGLSQSLSQVALQGLPRILFQLLLSGGTGGRRGRVFFFLPVPKAQSVLGSSLKDIRKPSQGLLGRQPEKEVAAPHPRSGPFP